MGSSIGFPRYLLRRKKNLLNSVFGVRFESFKFFRKNRRSFTLSHVTRLHFIKEIILFQVPQLWGIRIKI